MGAQQGRPPAWSDDDRVEFWTLVRGRIAERRLKQKPVARSLHIDRSVLSRRLNGEIKERPPREMVAQLAETLALSEEKTARLFQLAGHARPDGDDPPSAGVDVLPAVPPRLSDRSIRRGGRHNRLSRGIAAIAGGIAILLALAVVAAITRSSGPTIPTAITAGVPATATPVTSTAINAVTLGGVWLSPADGDTLEGPIHLVARAYPAQPADPAIGLVLFTLSWEGLHGPWQVACRLTRPVRQDTYECLWDPVAAGAPTGAIRISFDVYDAASPVPHVNMAPNGIRTITYAPRADRPSDLLPPGCADAESCPQLRRPSMSQPACSADGRSITWSWSAVAEATNYFLQVSTQSSLKGDIARSFALADIFNSWINSATPGYTTPAKPGIRYYALVNWTGPVKLSDGPSSEVIAITCPAPAMP